MDTMMQEILIAPGEIGFKEVPIPIVDDRQVLIRIKRIGICGSDIHAYHGKHPYVTYPLTQGHEVSGQIVGIGKGIDTEEVKLYVGQKVTIEPQHYCGSCYPCTHGKYNLCEQLKVMGFQSLGAASDYMAVDVSKVTPLPDNLSYDQGAMIEPLAVAVHAARILGDVNHKDIVILGAGPIGILMCQVMKAYGARKVMVTDVSDYRLELALKCGADKGVNTATYPFSEAFVDYFGSDKADVIIDCAGNNTTMNQGIQNARKGSTLLLVAVFSDMATVDLAKLNDSELTLQTSMMYRHEDYVEAIRLVSEREVRLELLMSEHFSFNDYGKAYEYIDNNRETTMKVFIDVDPEEG